jgi:chromosome segregation ATPase
LVSLTDLVVILVTSISVLIVIGVYTLYAVSKLQPRIDELENDLANSKNAENILKADLEKQLLVRNEILKSMQKEIDAFNSKLESSRKDLLDLTHQIGMTTNDTAANRIKTISIQTDILNLSKRLEQMEREAVKLFWAQQTDL